jgi:hypothetical protein
MKIHCEGGSGYNLDESYKLFLRPFDKLRAMAGQIFKTEFIAVKECCSGKTVVVRRRGVAISSFIVIPRLDRGIAEVQRTPVIDRNSPASMGVKKTTSFLRSMHSLSKIHT